jgi:hypothetical protein
VPVQKLALASLLACWVQGWCTLSILYDALELSKGSFPIKVLLSAQANKD